MSVYSSTYRIGTLTPSSNTVLEPMSDKICRDLKNVTLHYSRFRVLSISTKAEALGQFDLSPMLDAARLLADAKVDHIVWSGTSSGWLGLEADVQLCQAIEDTTGISTSTSVLALLDVLKLVNATKIGLVTPYLEKVQRRIIKTFEGNGLFTSAEEHLSLEDNHSFGMVDESKLEAMIRLVAKSQPDAITVFCTNLRGAAVVPRLEQELDIPIFDTVATGIWMALHAGQIDMSPISDAGRIFQLQGQ